MREPLTQQPFRPAAGGERRNLQVWRPRWRPGRKHHVERFSASQAARIRARNSHRSLRPLLCAAVRAWVRHDHRQCAAPRAALLDRRRRDYRGEDRRRAARVLADSRSRRGRHRHHPQPEADSVDLSRRLHQDPVCQGRQGRRGAGARYRSRSGRRDPRTRCAHRHHLRGRQAAHGAADQAWPRLRRGRQELRRRPWHRLDSRSIPCTRR